MIRFDMIRLWFEYFLMS